MKLPKINSSDYRLGLDKLDIDTLTNDLELIYNKVNLYLQSRTEFDRTDIPFINFVLTVKRDKEELIKFLLNYELKKKEMESHTSILTSKEVVLND